ncbi:MAG: hypothetical protein EBV86_08565 [Marivivens sp.]|nr:hypothetical protein [Marivivens sp.]
MNIKSISQKYAIERIKIEKKLYEPCPSTTMRAIGANIYKNMLKNEVIQDIKSLGYSSQEADKLFHNFVLKASDKINRGLLLDSIDVCNPLEDINLDTIKKILLYRHNLAIHTGIEASKPSAKDNANIIKKILLCRHKLAIHILSQS